MTRSIGLTAAALLAAVLGTAGCGGTPPLPAAVAADRAPDAALAARIDSAMKAVAAAPGDADLRADLAGVLHVHDLDPEAIAAWRAAIALRDDAKWHWHLSEVLERSGARAEAIEETRRVLALHHTYFPARTRLARLLLAEGRKDEALAEIRRATGVAPVDPCAWLVTAEIEAVRGDREAGELAARRAIQFALPGSPALRRAQKLLADILAATGRTEEATILLLRAGDGAPNSVWTDPWRSELAKYVTGTAPLTTAAREALAAGQAAAAAPVFEEIARRTPNDLRIQTELATAYRLTGRRAEAAKVLEGVLAKVPTDRGALMQLALVREETGDREGSLRAAADAIATAPGDATLRETRGLMHVRGGRLADALADFEACIAADEKTARYRIHAGFALAELGRMEEALARFAEAAALDPSEPDAPGGAALVFYRSGNHQAATNALAKAADLAPGGSLLQNVVRAEIRAANDAAEEKAAAERRARGEDGANQPPR